MKLFVELALLLLNTLTIMSRLSKPDLIEICLANKLMYRKNCCWSGCCLKITQTHQTKYLISGNLSWLFQTSKTRPDKVVKIKHIIACLPACLKYLHDIIVAE